MQRVISTWDKFRENWDSQHNFMLTGDCGGFGFAFPAIDRVVDELRKDELAEVRPGTKGTKLSKESIRDEFRALPIQRAMESEFGLAHYRLSRFDAPGKFLHGFKARVLDVWTHWLTREGFTFERCYPIIFISGKGCATNYHMDFSHVLAWQITGTKRFCGLRDPDKWADKQARLNYKPTEMEKPAGITAADEVCYLMRPGTMLWNQLLTPHWVEAGEEVAMSVNLSHGGLRYKGKLCRNEEELVAYRAALPEKAPEKVTGVY